MNPVPDAVARPASILRNTIFVTVLTFAAQLLTLGAQIVFAGLFGASGDTDAYFAAIALPLYVYLVLMSAMGVVFVPRFVEARANGGHAEATHVASGAINIAALTLALIALAGALFADPLLSWSAPGLSPASHELATRLVVILWPSIIGSALMALLTELWQAEGRFGWPAVVPVIGAGVNLALTVTLGLSVGIIGVALAWTAGTLVQGVLLMPFAARWWKPSLAFGHPAVRGLLIALGPLILANVFIRAITVAERFFASQLPAGELSHLTYASRIVTTVGVFLGAGLAAVIFPQMARNVAARDLVRLRELTSRGVRSLWLVVAPVMALLVALADPTVRVLFEHGAFARGDSAAVALLIRVYALSLIGITLAPLAARGLFALQATRLLAIGGTLETLAYIGYGSMLAGGFGAPGIAVAFVIHALVPLVWYALYLRRVTAASGLGMLRSFIVTCALGAVAGASAWLVSRAIEEPLPAVVLGGLAGAAVYAAGLLLTRPPELAALASRWPSRA